MLLNIICFIALISCNTSPERVQLKPWNCKAITINCSDECDFLKDFIEYGYIKIDTTKLQDKEYYKSFVTKSLPSEYFNNANILFKIFEKEIKEYGKCFIGEFKFKNHYGIDQGSVYVMINTSIDEVYVFYLEKIMIEKNSSIKLFFNTRGKVSQRSIYFSKKDGLFLLDCNSVQ